MNAVMGSNVEKVDLKQLKKTLNPTKILDYDNSIYLFITIQWSPIFYVTS